MATRMNDPRQWCEQRVAYWWSVARAKLGNLLPGDSAPPEVLFTARRSRVAGRAWTGRHRVEVYLHYAVAYGFEYDPTLLHEVAHLVVCRLARDVAMHGDLFEWVCNKVLGSGRSTRYHTYNSSHANLELEHARRLVRLTQLQQELRIAAQEAQP